ncbi:MAG TPA: hypothetical protein VHU92_24165 [Streptosporangiaceae bacterium]|jgi:uncharacterized protein YbjT (DUF2867 family)|nr:hypothetical protein [Streptosporangiaceae bacterium]
MTERTSHEETPVLVTGGSGYVGTQLIAAPLRAGRPVRATVRSLAREAGLRAAVRRGHADDAGLHVELGCRPRPAQDTIVETAESLRDLGLLEPGRV